MSSYVFSLGNSPGKRIPETLMLEGKSVTFTLDNYIKTTFLTRYRFYLLMKKNHDIFSEVFEEVDSSDDDFSSSIMQRRQSCKSQDDINASVASCLNETQSLQQSTLIGSSAEREQLKNEQQKAFEDSIARDREKLTIQSQSTTIENAQGNCSSCSQKSC